MNAVLHSHSSKAVIMRLMLIFCIFAIYIELSDQIRNSDYKCGIKVKSSGLAVNGTATEPNEWPWMAALVLENSMKFICGGSIVSDHHVLTAAHCINDKRKKTSLTPRELLVYLGKHNLTAVNDNSEWFHPQSILVHPDWEADVSRFDADLAILVSEVPFRISSILIPVCLWTELEENGNYFGTVVGWGASEKTEMIGNTDIPNKVDVRRVPSAKCYEDFPQIASIGSSRTFCAGGVKENSGPCTGDSGGGYFIEDNGVWYIQGIVSSSMLTVYKTCDVSKHSIYTKVNEYLSWMNFKEKAYDVDLNGILVALPINLGDGEKKTSIYRCKGLTVTQPSGKVVLDVKKSLKKVEKVEIKDQNVVYFPNGFGSLFKVLKYIEVALSNLRFIDRMNFENMEELVKLELKSNPITNIPNDAFYELKNLKSIHITGSSLVLIHKNLIANNTRLTHLDFSSNLIESLPYDLFRNNLQLQSLDLNSNRIKLLDEDIFINLKNLQVINLNQNIIQHVSPKVFSHLTGLKQIILHNNRLKSLHANTFAANKDLTGLFVRYNQIEEFPATLLKNNLRLKEVAIGFNKVQDIPEKLFENLADLEKLELGGMSLNEFPSDMFSSLSSLKELRMMNIDLKALHKDLLNQNPQLTFFGATFNKFEELDSTFFKNNLKLKMILLASNRLKRVSGGLLRNLKNLEALSLEFNLIETISIGSFDDLTNLSQLNLKDNNLKNLDQNIFANLANLKFLDMSSNQLEHLPARLFQNNLKLESISFDYNRIKKIETQFDPSRSYKRLSFIGNICIDKRQTQPGPQAMYLILQMKQSCSGI